MRYSSVLVENEDHSLARLRRILGSFPESVEVVGEATDGLTAVSTINRLRPALVFLDIELPDLNGFQVLQRLEFQPAVIFTTAFNQHALEAFRTLAVDYLLKPIDAEMVERSLNKLHVMGLDQTELVRRLTRLLDGFGGSPYLSRLLCKIGDRTVVVRASEVLYFQADAKYVSVFTANADYLIDTPLLELERKLNPTEFVRIHRSTLVNVAFIKEFQREHDGRGRVILRDAKATELHASRSYFGNLRTL